MTEQEALIRRVCLAPDDDTPRLIYADWCDEHGEQERAEFIRVQLALAGLPPEHVCLHGMGACGPKLKCPGCDLRRPERELLSGSLGLWFRGKGYPQTAEYVDAGRYKRRAIKKSLAPIVAVLWARGFADSITCTAAQWLTHGPTIVQQQPITRVVLSDTLFTPQGDGLRRVMLYAGISVAMNANDAALLWARRVAGLEAVLCIACGGSGGDRLDCPGCNGTGKEVR